MTHIKITYDELPSVLAEVRNDVNWIKQFLQQNEDSDPQSTQSDRFLSITEAAQFLGLAKQTLYGLVSRKLIPVMKRNKRLYFSKTQLTVWIESGRQLTYSEIASSSRAILVKKDQPQISKVLTPVLYEN